MKLRSFTVSVCATAAILLLFYFWRVHWHLGLVRYFDPDEFMYPHWAHSILQGRVPYRDFFIITTPLFIYALTPLFALAHGAQVMIAGRALAFVISVILGISAGVLFYHTRRSWIAVTVPLFLALLPMPQDKFMEVRPDTLAMVLLVWGYIYLIRWMRTHKPAYGIATGISLMLSLLTLQKSLPFVALAGLTALIHAIAQKKPFRLIPLITGSALTLGIFALWVYASGAWQAVWYDIITAPVEHARISTFNGVPYDFYFRPNPAYYGQPGISPGWIMNALLWILAAGMAVFRLAAAARTQRLRETEYLMSVSFLGSIMLYIWFYPLKFPQYLIPSAVFAAYFLADFLHGIRSGIVKKNSPWKHAVFALVFLSMLYASWQSFDRLTEHKFGWTNAGTIAKMEDLYARIPPDSYALDLEGRTIYYRDPYIVCCLPFGQFAPFLSRPLPSLPEALERTKTRYIHQAEINRLASHPEADRAFIEANYAPTLNGELWVAKYW